MKIRNVLVGAAAAIALCSAGAVSAGKGNNTCPPGQAAKDNCGKFVKAPEIDAAAGVQAVALLSGIMLLMGERARRRSS